MVGECKNRSLNLLNDKFVSEVEEGESSGE